MPPRSKQSDRNANRKLKTAVVEESPEVVGDGITFLDRFKDVATSSVLFMGVSVFPQLVKEIASQKATPSPTRDEAEKEASEGASEQVKPKNHDETFQIISTRLTYGNPLGVFSTHSEAIQRFKNMAALKIDGGPKPKRKGSPGVERVAANFQEYLLEYSSILWFLMTLRAVLFRSYFACLPWLFIYQLISVLLPLQHFEKFPQVPLEKIDVKFRVAGALVLHSLMWFFFVYEVVFCAWFFEKFILIGIFVCHAYVARPVEN
eukprot:CAMPEP_0194478170 /NCGR_PEP_ID=MMETSP0253-20130528/1717_1 /TAXON_ID=2966 /ORGANISM="Noctiluca scintillans" /LENGTH=261 /DNA_ID=CAMNT_0039317235 /DNA_START=31 /DNA_END=816 /DNA_ORIENTATION=+